MVEKQEISNFWKGLILLTFLISLIIFCNFIFSKIPNYRYETKYIQLDNKNYGEVIWVTDYICSDGVKINNIQFQLFNQHWFYASTWIDAPVHYGECFIKYKIKIN